MKITSTRSGVSTIKRAQKESVLLRLISQLFTHASNDDKRLRDLFVNRIELSSDKGICYVYFYSTKGESFFKETLEILKLYKPSMRKSISSEINSRRTPELTFRYDTQFDKIQKIEELIEQVKEKIPGEAK